MYLRFAIRLLVLSAFAFTLFVGGLYTWQRDLIYPVPQIDRSVPENFEPIVYTTSDGLELNAGYRPAMDGMPTVLFFHGNGMDWQTTFFTTELLAEEGYGVLAAEYRGYGGNPGEPTEDGLYRDGRAALAWLEAQGVTEGDIVLVGNSLGSGVATELASEMQPRALILVSAFKSMTATAQNAYPYVPVDWLLVDRFDNIAKIGAVTAPVLVVHGSDDQLIPLAHARELAESARSAQLIVLSGFGHNMAGDETAQQPQLAFLESL